MKCTNNGVDSFWLYCRGYERTLVAQSLGVAQVPVDQQDYVTEAEEWSDLIANDKIAELSQTDGDLWPAY
jgi:hypothetical protein